MFQADVQIKLRLFNNLTLHTHARTRTFKKKCSYLYIKLTILKCLSSTNYDNQGIYAQLNKAVTGRIEYHINCCRNKLIICVHYKNDVGRKLNQCRTASNLYRESHNTLKIVENE